MRDTGSGRTGLWVCVCGSAGPGVRVAGSRSAAGLRVCVGGSPGLCLRVCVCGALGSRAALREVVPRHTVRIGHRVVG
eukprot:8398852-Pyramimonas_sp.AAC.1